MVTTLGLVSILLVLIIIFQISRANDMLGIIRDEEKAMDRSNKINAGLFLVFLVVFMVGSFWSTYAYSDLFLMDPASEHGVWIKDLFFWTLVATVPVFVATHIALFWFAFKYKRRKNETGYYYPENNRLELVWTVIPSIVLILLVYEGMRTWYAITGPVPKDETALVVEATGQQFQWILRYSGEDNKLGDKSIRFINSENPIGQDWTDSSNKDDFIAEELHLPVGKRVMVKINSMDVLHSFSLPHFYVKMDAVPGIPTQFHFVPTKTTKEMRAELGDPDFNYELACQELCGQAHFNMRKVVVVESQDEFDAWSKEQEPMYKKAGMELERVEENTFGAADVEKSEKEKDLASTL